MWNSRPHIDEQKLDRLGDELLRAFDAGESEINTAATSPFLYRRIRVRIEAEERRRAEERGSWLALLVTARRAIPAFALVAIAAASLHWVYHNQPHDRGSIDRRLETASEYHAYAPDVVNDYLDESLIGWRRNESNQNKEKQ